MADGASASGGLAPISTTQTGVGRLEVISPLARWKKLRKAVRESARLHISEMEQLRERHHVVMIRLSYSGSGRPESEDGDARPNHVRSYLTAVREWANRQGFQLRYVWVGELQERGALHYHVVYWLPKRITMPKADKRGWWSYGSTNTTPVTDPIGYVTKYISKLRSKGSNSMPFPKGFRMHGCGGLTRDGREVRSYSLMPLWIRDLGDWTLRFRRAVGGGFFSKLTGEWWESPWQVFYVERRPGVGAVIHIGLKATAGA